MRQDFKFEILNKSSKSKARTGIIKTPHGEIKTPAFVTVGTKGTVKSLTPEDLDTIDTQFVFVNTYHMVLSPTPDIVAAAGGIHAFSKINKPIITDSGGFQVFSLGRERKVSLTPGLHASKDEVIHAVAHLLKVTDDGVEFRSPVDGTLHMFTPEFSIEAQKKIGADFIVAFDECLGLGVSERQTERSLKRTHEWAKRSLVNFTGPAAPSSQKVLVTNTAPSSGPPPVVSPVKQQLYGVIQGGMFKKLRQQSAEFIASLPFWGLAIGGVSVGETKEEMQEQTKWVMEVIQEDIRPRHLLGIGHVDDILDMVTMGVDTFDCVTPTRDARVGKLYAAHPLEITKLEFKSDLNPVDKKCGCYTCKNFSRAYLHHLFKQRELLAYRLATIHNLTFMERLFGEIRRKIENGEI